MRIVHVVVTLKTKGEVWQGDGFWDLPDESVDRSILVDPIRHAITMGINPLIDLNAPWSIKIEGQEYSLHGGLEQAMLRKLKGLSLDDPGRVIWAPIILTTWSLQGGN